MDTGWQSPAAAVSTGGSPLVPFSNASNILVADGSTATAALPGGGKSTSKSELLQATGFPFASLVPAGATITGVQFRAKVHKTGSGHLVMDQGFLRRADGCFGGNRSFTEGITGTPTWFSLGGAVDLWNAQLTPAVVGDGAFGLSLQFQEDGSGSTVHVDAVEGKVFYTP